MPDRPHLVKTLSYRTALPLQISFRKKRPALDTFWAAVERGERRGNRKIMAKSKLINGGADDDYDARHAMHEIGATAAAAAAK